jgi:adenylate kinase
VRKFVIMGIQGSGKGTQAKHLAADLELEHISVGDIFRWNVQHHTKIGAQVKRTVASGRLVDDELVETVVREQLQAHDWNFGFIIDGFPRNARQAEFFLEGYDIDGVINLDLPDEEVHRRVLARRLCSDCGLDYNLIAHRPQIEDTCGVCQGRLVTRPDDNPEALALRLADYHQQTKPLIEIFQRKEYVATVDATQPVGEVQAVIRQRFKLPPMKERTFSPD